MKLFIISAEIGSIILLPRLLELLKISPHLSLLYILNPLVIIETVGNLHFEGITVFLLIVTFYLLLKGKTFVSSIYFGLALGIKLIPFMLVPLVIQFLGLKKAIGYFSLSAFVFLIFFIPYIDHEFIDNFQSSLALYFRSFEFNASIYYLIRSLGYYFKGYNIIQTSGWVLGVIALLLVIGFSFFQKKRDINTLFYLSLLSLTCFYFLSTTVHPWYLINLIVLAVLSRTYWFLMIWAYLIGLSYFTYSTPDSIENQWLLILEYGIVFIVFILEIIRRHKHNVQTETQ